jgi:predicted MFS family arabinose efflux permease
MTRNTTTDENDLPSPLAPQPAVATGSPGAVRVVAFGVMAVIYGLAYFQRTGVPGTVFDELQHDFGLNASAVTALGAVFIYVYAGMQLVVGMAADRYGGRRTLLFGSVIMCAGALLFPCAHSTTMLFASRVLIGFGSSFVYLSIVKEVDTLFAARHFAGLLGLAMLASYLGNIAATLPFERAVNVFGWRDTLTAVAGMSLVAVAVAWVVLRRLERVPVRRESIPLKLVWDVLRNRRSRALLVCGMINFPVAFVIQGVLGKKFLQDAVGLSSAEAAAFVLVMASACGAAAVCSGPVLRLTGQRRKPVILGATGMILLSTVLMLVAVLTAAPGWVFLAGYVLLALSTIGFPASAATMKEVNRPDAVAVTISVLNTVAYVGVGVLSNAAGAILDGFGSQAEITEARIVYPTAAYATLFACLAGLALISTLVTLFLVPETRGRILTLQEIERELA